MMCHLSWIIHVIRCRMNDTNDESQVTCQKEFEMLVTWRRGLLGDCPVFLSYARRSYGILRSPRPSGSKSGSWRGTLTSRISGGHEVSSVDVSSRCTSWPGRLKYIVSLLRNRKSTCLNVSLLSSFSLDFPLSLSHPPTHLPKLQTDSSLQLSHCSVNHQYLSSLYKQM